MNKFRELFNLDLPIIQAGMVWCSGAKLAAASANEGIIGTIGAGSMNKELLDKHILKAQNLISKNNHLLAVNFPLLYHDIEAQLKVALDRGIKIFITSAGSPNKYTKFLKDEGRLVIHVCSSARLAKKCENAGVDAVVAEGFEAGGHNGRNETTTMVLIPEVVNNVNIPVIAAGGIGQASQIRAAHALGASAVQIGSRFVVTEESSAHHEFKNAIINASPGMTKLLMKKYIPVRLLENKFSKDIQELESAGASKEELKTLLGKQRAKRGMLDGDLDQGELEIGQVSGLINNIKTVKELVQEFRLAYQE